MSTVFAALRGNVTEAAVMREQQRLAAEWAARQLQARSLAALAEAVARRQQLEQQLGRVGQSLRQDVKREAFRSWRAAAALSMAEGQLVTAARRRSARHCLQHRFAAWHAAAREAAVQRAKLHRHQHLRAGRLLARVFAGWQAAVQQEKDLQRRLEAGRARMAHMRAAWALDVWRQRAADSKVQQQRVAVAQRCVGR